MNRLSRFPTREKLDVINWDNIPLVECDMNYRIEKLGLNLEAPTMGFAATSAFAAALLASAVASALPFVVSIFSPQFTVLAIAIAITAVTLLNRETADQFKRGTKQVLLSTLAAIFIFAIVPSTMRNFLQLGLLALAYCHIRQCVEGVGTLFVYWSSASPTLDRFHMLAVRHIWSSQSVQLTGDNEKFRGVVYAVDIYRANLALLLPVWFGLLFLIFSSSSSLSLGPSIVVCFGFTSAVVIVILAVSIPGAITATLQAIRLFVMYGQGHRLPPWCFKSPVGRAAARQSLLLCTFIITSIGFASCFPTSPVFVFANERWVDIGLNFALQGFAILLTTPIVVFAILAIVLGPALARLSQLCESKASPLHQNGMSTFDCYTDRITNSKTALERNSLWLGQHRELGIPIPVDIALAGEHINIIGPTGSGKTALGLSSLVTQLINRNDGPVIVFDGKGDRALFNLTKDAAEQSGRCFKWFTTANGKSTFIFNPFDQSHLSQLTLQETVGLFLLSFNLIHGDDYGRAWFAAAAKAAFTIAVKKAEKKPVSFREFERIVELVMAEHDEFKAAGHLLFIMRSLAEFDQINLSQRTNNHSACQHAIHMPDVIENDQIVYFSFESLLDPLSTGEITRLGAFSIISAAAAYKEKHGVAAKVYVVVDEAQNFIAKNVAAALEQARSLGVSFTLAHQTRSQLNPPGGLDLREIVDSCTAVKLYFGARDPATRKHLAEISGEVGYVDASWQQFVPDLMSGHLGIRHAVKIEPDAAVATVREQIGPRLADDDIQAINHRSNLAAIAIERFEGLTQFRGAFPIHLDYIVSKKKHEILDSKPWPEADERTIVTQSRWTEDDANQRPPKEPLTVPLIGGGISVEDLEKIKQRTERSARRLKEIAK